MESQLKIIRNGFIAACTLFVPMFTSAQKLLQTNVDKFTGKTINSTTTEKIASTEKFTSSVANLLFACVLKVNDSVFVDLPLAVTIADHNRFLVPAGSHALVKLSDNSVVTITNTKDVKTYKNKVATGPFVSREYWEADMRYTISPADVARIASSKVTAVRVETEGGNFDFDLKDRDADVFVKMFALIQTVH